MSTINSYVGHGVTFGSGYTSPLTITTAGTVDYGGGIAVFAAATYANPVLVNQGTILDTDASGGAGVAFAAGGSIDNSGTAALIEGYFGVDIRGAAGTITNSGTIDGTAGAAIYLQHGGSVDNSGTAALIQSMGTAGGGYGVQIFGAFGRVTNDGTILGGTLVAAVKLQSGGSVDNTGTAALIRGAGVLIQGTGAVTNAGTIDGTSSGGVDLGSGSVDNTGTAALIQGEGTGHHGVRIHSVGTVSNAGRIIGAGYGVELGAGSTLINSGTISGGSGNAVYFDGFGAAVLVVLEHGYVFGGALNNKRSTSSSDTLELAGTAGAVMMDFDKAGAGFTNFGIVSFGAASGNDDIVQITDTTVLPGTISGFTQPHDIVDLTQFTNPGTAVVTFNAGTDQLTITEGAQSVTLQLDTSLNYTGVTWTPGPDSGTGTDIAACFCRGTMILTPGGEVPVEALAIGDAVVTLSGEARRLRWIGRRAYDGRFIAGNPGVLPICVTAGSLADGVPARDLFLSPEHSLCFDGALAQAKHLLNGATITQAEAVAAVEYFHIELDSHDVIFADGAPAETYTDCDNRYMFANGAECAALYPDDDRPTWDFCLPRLEWDDPALNEIRAALLARALQLGHETDLDPDLHLIVDGEAVRPNRTSDGRLYRFAIPADASDVRLASLASVPAEITAEARDTRRLGVPLERLMLRSAALCIKVGHTHAALCEGFHGAEEAHRWTDGLALLPPALLRLFDGPVTLELHLAASTLAYRTPAAAKAVAAA